MSKSLFKSKTFWFNVATVAVHLAGLLPASIAVPVAAVGNIILRFVTSTPVSIP